jgi:quercetin dioxygenase-like cupin family protein
MVVKSLDIYSHLMEEESQMANDTTPTIQLGSIRVDFLVTAEVSDGSLTMFECLIPAGSRVPVAHSHDGFEETNYVLEGTCTWTVDGQERELAEGESLSIHRGQVHGFENRGSEDVRFLAIATPGVFGPTYFQELADVLGAGGAPDPAAIVAVMRRHGLTPAPPAQA